MDKLSVIFKTFTENVSVTHKLYITTFIKIKHFSQDKNGKRGKNTPKR